MQTEQDYTGLDCKDEENPSLKEKVGVACGGGGKAQTCFPRERLFVRRIVPKSDTKKKMQSRRGAQK